MPDADAPIPPAPGPYRYDGALPEIIDRYNGAAPEITDSQGHVIACVEWAPEADATGALLAAAWELREALADLVALKSVKDALGKTPEYEAQQPAAWERAREALRHARGQGDEGPATLRAGRARTEAPPDA